MKTITLVTFIFLGRVADATFVPSTGCMMKGLAYKGSSKAARSESSDQACNDQCAQQDNSEICQNGAGACCEGWSRLPSGANNCKLYTDTDEPYQFKGKGATSWVKDNCTVVKDRIEIDVKMLHCFRKGGYSDGVRLIGRVKFNAFYNRPDLLMKCQTLCHFQRFPHRDEDFCDVATFKMNYEVRGKVADVTAECLLYQYTNVQIRFDDDKSALSKTSAFYCDSKRSKVVKFRFGQDNGSQ